MAGAISGPLGVSTTVIGDSLAATGVIVLELAWAPQASRQDGLAWFFGLWVVWAMVMSPFARLDASASSIGL